MSGKAGLTIVKPLPLIVAAVTTVFAVPAFEITRVWVEVAPTFTFPKNRFVGLTLNPGVPAVAVEEPLPETDRVLVGSEAFEVKETVPVAVPLAFGLNVMDIA